MASLGTKIARSLTATRRSFVLSAVTRSILPRQLVFSEMLLARNASTAAAQAHIPVDESLDSTHFHTLRDTVHPHTLKAITVHPFQHTHMSIVQAEIFPLLPDLALPTSNERDLLVKAKTGTGKTMAFLVPAIEARVNAINTHVTQSLKDAGLESSRQQVFQAERAYANANVGTLVISPTRELATQIAVEASNLTSHHQGFQVQLLLGGESKHAQLRSWRGRKDIVVATPGRLLDYIKTEPAVLEAIKSTRTLVLDEADTLLDMGFQEDIQRIIKYLPPTSQRQTFLFSATVSPKVQEVARATLSPGHKFINCVQESDTDTHAHIPQYHTVLSSGSDVLPHVLRLIAHDQLLAAKEGRKSKVVLFLNTTKMVQLFAELMKDATGTLPFKGARKTVVYEMHSQRTMSNRTRVSAAFRNDVATRSAAVLVTSDVSARGVDYPGVTRVIQLGVPSSGDVYTHRVGRTGRAGRTDGRGDLVLMPWEMGFVRRELGDVGLKPLKRDDLTEQIVSLINESKDESRPSSTISYTQAALSEIETVSAELGRDVAAADLDAISGAMTSTLGFYLGRLQQLGVRANDVVTGMQSYFKEMCGLSEPLYISKKMLEMMGGGAGGGGYSNARGMHSRSRSSGYGGGYGSRDGNDRNVRGSWKDGKPPARRGGSYGGSGARREGGYGSSSPSSYGRSSYDKPSYSSGSSYDKPSYSSGSSYDKPSYSSGSSYDKPSYSSGSSYDKPSYSSGSSSRSSYGSREGRSSSSHTPRSSSNYGSESYGSGGYGGGSRVGLGRMTPVRKRSWDEDE